MLWKSSNSKAVVGIRFPFIALRAGGLSHEPKSDRLSLGIAPPRTVRAG